MTFNIPIFYVKWDDKVLLPHIQLNRSIKELPSHIVSYSSQGNNGVGLLTFGGHIMATKRPPINQLSLMMLNHCYYQRKYNFPAANAYKVHVSSKIANVKDFNTLRKNLISSCFILQHGLEHWQNMNGSITVTSL